MSQTPTKRPSVQQIIINPEADAKIGGMTKRALIGFVVSMFFWTVVMALTAATHLVPARYNEPFQLLASCFVVIPFFISTGRLYAERLKIGRELSEKGEYRQAIAALDAFEPRMQRMFDRTGEAHYLLSRAYTAVGSKDRAEKCRQFVISNRPGPWADKLKGSAKHEPVRISQVKSQDVRPRPAKSKPRRRF